MTGLTSISSMYKANKARPGSVALAREGGR